MKPNEVFDKTQDITDDFVGVFLGGEIRAGWTKYGWQAYVLKYNGKGNIESVRMLRIKKGKKKGRPVRTHFYWEGIGDLVEQIIELNKKGQL